MSRTSLRGIPFRVDRSKRGEFVKTFYFSAFISLITIGIGTSWMMCAINQKRWGCTYFGNIKMNFQGKGLDFLLLNLAISIFGTLSLGIYVPWGKSKILRWRAENMKLANESFVFHGTGLDMFFLYLKSFLVVVLTLGLGAPWIFILNSRYYIDNIGYAGSIDYSELKKVTDENRASGVTEGITDLMDIDFGL